LNNCRPADTFAKKTGRYSSVVELLQKQKVRDVRDLESYKLSECHPASAGIDLGSEESFIHAPVICRSHVNVPKQRLSEKYLKKLPFILKKRSFVQMSIFLLEYLHNWSIFAFLNNKNKINY